MYKNSNSEITHIGKYFHLIKFRGATNRYALSFTYHILDHKKKADLSADVFFLH